VDIDRPAPPAAYPAVKADHREVGAVATGVAGLVGGLLLGAGYRFARQLDAADIKTPPPSSGQEG
jgi:hypothetical protein